MLDHFIFEGPHGKHIGMVFEVMGYNLLKIMKQYDWEGIPLPIVRILAKQLLISLDYLHRMCNVIHTDVKPENAILCPNEDQLFKLIEDTPAQFKSHIKGRIDLSQFFSKEQNEINKRKKKNQKKKKKKKAKQNVENEDEANEGEGKQKDKPEGPLDETVQVKTCDYGNGCWIDHHFTSTIQTRQYRSPEVILGIEYDETCDLWSYACMVFELITGDYLFNPKSGKNYGKEDDHLAYIIELIGQPPKDWLMSGKRSRKFFTTKGNMKKIVKHKIWVLEDVLKTKYCFKEEEAKQMSDFLLQPLKWKPEDRPSAQDMLQHPWFEMANKYDYKVESDDEGEGEGEEDSEGEEDEDDSSEEGEAKGSGDEWETVDSESDASEPSSFDIVDHP